MTIPAFPGTPRARGDAEDSSIAPTSSLRRSQKSAHQPRSPPPSEISCRMCIPAHAASRLALALPLRYHILAHAEGAHSALRAF